MTERNPNLVLGGYPGIEAYDHIGIFMACVTK